MKEMSGIYGVAFLGAAVYYIQHATSFWSGVLGVLPALVLYKAMELLKM